MSFSDPALNYFEPQCGQCKFWAQSTHYISGKRRCQNPDAPDYKQEKSIVAGCTYFLLKGGTP